MSSIDLACKLLCASESAYAISTTDTSGQYNPLDMLQNGVWVPDPTKAQYTKYYNALEFVENPYIVVSAQIEAAMVGKTSSEIIIAFRGTLPPALNWDSFFDWLQDFWAKPESNINLPGEVHSGFLLAVISLADGINDAVKALDPNGSLPIYVTGHSKGGGMAPIATMYFKNLFQMQISQTITFAGPNPGDADFCNSYNSTYPNDLRYENYLDIVPLLPPDAEFIDSLEAIPDLPTSFINLLNEAKGWDYETVGTLQYIDAEGVAKSYSSIEADLLLPVRISEIVEKIVTLDFSAIGDAHHASCGYRYMQGTCTGSICGTS